MRFPTTTSRNCATTVQRSAHGLGLVNRRMRNWVRIGEAGTRTSNAKLLAASLGQVHKAVGLRKRFSPASSNTRHSRLRGGPEAKLRLVFHFTGGDKAIASEITEISARLREELDYAREAANMALTKLMLRDESGSRADVLAELSTSRLLTMTWLDGLP